MQTFFSHNILPLIRKFYINVFFSCLRAHFLHKAPLIKGVISCETVKPRLTANARKAICIQFSFSFFSLIRSISRSPFFRALKSKSVLNSRRIRKGQMWQDNASTYSYNLTDLIRLLPRGHRGEFRIGSLEEKDGTGYSRLN